MDRTRAGAGARRVEIAAANGFCVLNIRASFDRTHRLTMRRIGADPTMLSTQARIFLKTTMRKEIRRDLAVAIGHRIRTERIRKGFLARAVSKDVGVTQGMWSRLESGQRLPSLNTLQRVAEVLGVRISHLLEIEQPVGIRRRALASSVAKPRDCAG